MNWQSSGSWSGRRERGVGRSDLNEILGVCLLLTPSCKRTRTNKKGKNMNTTSTLLDSVEFVENGEPRCPCILILDVSGSMRGEPINTLNRGIEQFKSELMQDSLAVKRVELAVVTFNSCVEVVQDFVTPDAFVPPI